MAEGSAEYVSSDCPIAGRRIAQGITQSGAPEPRRAHPLTLLRIAFGID
jgi:hypothetical protein